MTSTTQTKREPTFDVPFGRFTEQSEELLSSARKAGARYLDLYETSVERAVEFERRIGAATQQEWLKNLIEGHAELTTQVTEATTAAARELLK